MSSLLKSIIAIVLTGAAITAFVMVSEKNKLPQSQSNYTEYNNSNPSTGKDGLCVSQVTFPNQAGTSCTVTMCDNSVSSGIQITNNQALSTCGGGTDSTGFSCLVKECGAIEEDVDFKGIGCSASYNAGNEACSVNCPGTVNDVTYNVSSAQFDAIQSNCNSFDSIGESGVAQCIAGGCSTTNNGIISEGDSINVSGDDSAVKGDNDSDSSDNSSNPR